jgi:hypothetical protein
MNTIRLRPSGETLAGLSAVAANLRSGQRAGLRAWRAVLERPLTISWRTRYSSLYVMPNLQRRVVFWAMVFWGLVIYVGAPVGFYLLYLRVPLWQLLPALVVVNGIAGDVRQRRRRPLRRKGFDRLMLDGGVVPTVKDGRQPKIGERLGKPKRDEYGISQKFRINGSTAEAVQKKADLLAGLCGQPARLFKVEHDPSDPPNVFTIWLGDKSRGKEPVLAQVPDEANFHEPFRIGQTRAGRVILAMIFEFNTLVGGIPGMGKTSVVRQFILHALLDPEGQVFLVDGKGSKKDYRDAEHAYTGYVDGNDDDAIDQVEALLNHVHDLVNEANSNDTRLRLLLVLDEWQDIRSGADKDQLKRIDTLIIRIHKKGRATGMHLLLATQRASAVSIPTEMRSLFRQALAFRQKNGTDYGMVLGHAPTETAPMSPGEAIVSGDEGQVFGSIDLLSQEQWVEATHRLRRRDSVELVVETESDPVAQEVRRAAQSLTEERITPSALWEAIDVNRVAEAGILNSTSLGKFLGVRGVVARKSGDRYYLRAELLKIE